MPRGLLLAGGVAAAPLIVLALAWLLPPHLDWTRYRETIEEVASAQLGRKVRIEGAISLTLVPEPALTAHRVAIADSEEDQGGIALDVSALRLRVAAAPLLTGRIVPRALVLREPELRVPWPLPDPFRPRSPDWLGSFSAQIEGGRLVIGRTVFTGIDATIGISDRGMLSVSGTAAASGLAWHITARLGLATANGAEPLDAAFDGQGRATGLGANFSGEIAADGSVAGRIAGRGPDLSLLLPAPPDPFRGEGRVSASGGLVTADDLALEIGGSAVRGTVVLRVNPAERLDVALAASRLDLDRWIAALRGGVPARPWGMPVGLDVSIDAAGLGGGIVRRVRAAFDLAQGEAAVRQADALLPGNAVFRAAGRLAPLGGEPRFTGRATLGAPDLRTTLRWLDGLGGARTLALPPEVLRSGNLAATIVAAPGRVVLSDLTGAIDGSSVAGSLAWQHGKHERTDADLRFDRLALDPWLPAEAPGLAALPELLAGTLRIRVAHAQLRDLGVEDFRLDAAREDGALVVHELTGVAEGALVTLSGRMDTGGRVSEGRLSVSAADATPIEALVPPGWRGTPTLWGGPVALRIAAAGPPEALATSVALDFADARLDASPVVDLAHRSWSGPATLRHPGAGRFLSAIGALPAADWLGEGSLSIAGQFSGAPGRVSADSFDLTAGLLRASGQAAVDTSGLVPRVAARITAESLPVAPSAFAESEPLPLAALRGWQGSVRLHADRLFSVGAPEQTLLEQVDGTLTVADGRLRLDPFAARRGSATLQGAVGLDTAEEPPKLDVAATLSGLDIGRPVTGWPVDVAAGIGEATMRLRGEGHSPAALAATATGTIHLALRNGVLTGLDLPGVRLAVAQAGAAAAGATEATVRAALVGGTTPFTSLECQASVTNGVAALGDATLSAPSGAIEWSGAIRLSVGRWAIDTDLRAVLRPDLRPDVTNPPAIGLRMTGGAGTPQRTPELAGLARWLADHPAR